MEATADATMSSEITLTLKTNLPAPYICEETQVQLSSDSTAKDLTKVLLQLFDNPEPLAKRKFTFMVDNTFLTSTLQDLLTRLNKSNEQTIEVFYLFQLEKPKPKHTLP